MFDQAQRCLWLEDQLWPKLREMFPTLKALPAEALITVGYPASGARGRSEKIKPCEVNTQWTGNPNEKVFVSIHPVYFDSSENIAKAIMFGLGKHTGGARWGHRNLGLTKQDDGSITASPETEAKIKTVLTDVGEPPAGFGIAFPVRTVERGRLRRYVNVTKFCEPDATTGDTPVHGVIRCASDTLSVACKVCGNDYIPG